MKKLSTKRITNRIGILYLLVAPVLISFGSIKDGLTYCCLAANNKFLASGLDADDDRINFVATHLINFDQTKILSTGEPIDTAALIKKKDLALQLLDSIVNTPRFKEEVLNGHFTHKKGMTNLQIYNLFMSNSPEIKNIRQHLTLEIDTTYLWNVTYQQGSHPSIGYDNQPGDSLVHTVQVQLIKNLSVGDYAAHIAHEYCHMIGFTHPWPWKYRGVPYGIQDIISDMLNIKSDHAAYR